MCSFESILSYHSAPVKQTAAPAETEPAESFEKPKKELPVYEIITRSDRRISCDANRNMVY